MKSEEIQKLYKEIKEIAFEIEKLGLPQEFLEMAKKEQKNRKNIIFKQFKKEHPKLMDRINKLHKSYNSKGCPIIFHDIDCDKYYKYDPDDIHPANLFVVIVFSAIEYEIFYDEHTFGNACFAADNDEYFEQYELLEAFFNFN